MQSVYDPSVRVSIKRLQWLVESDAGVRLPRTRGAREDSELNPIIRHWMLLIACTQVAFLSEPVLAQSRSAAAINSAVPVLQDNLNSLAAAEAQTQQRAVVEQGNIDANRAQQALAASKCEQAARKKTINPFDASIATKSKGISANNGANPFQPVSAPPSATSRSATPSAEQAAIQKVIAALQAANAAKPDAATAAAIKKLQWYAAQDAESKTDGEIFKEKILSKLPSGDDWSPQRGPPTDLAAEEGALAKFAEVADTAQAFLEACTPSYTAGPTLDQVDPLTAEERLHMNEQLNQQAAAQRILQQALDQANTLVYQRSRQAPLAPLSQSPQLKKAPSTSPPPNDPLCPPGAFACH